MARLTGSMFQKIPAIDKRLHKTTPSDSLWIQWETVARNRECLKRCLDRTISGIVAEDSVLDTVVPTSKHII